MKKTIVVCDVTGSSDVPTLPLKIKVGVTVECHLDAAGDSDEEYVPAVYDLDLSHAGAMLLLEAIFAHFQSESATATTQSIRRIVDNKLKRR